MARIFFCAMPAALLGFGVGILHPALGAIVFVGVYGFGWDVTRPRPERGEY